MTISFEAFDSLDEWSSDSVEMGKCSTNPWYFRRYVITIDEDGNEDVFPDWPYLKEFLFNLHVKRRVIVLKSRQMLLTWAIALYAVWLMIFKRNQTILVISQDKRKAKEVVKRCRDVLKRLPGWMKEKSIDERRPSTEEIRWGNGSRIISLPSVPDAARTFTCNLGIIDEAAFNPDFAGSYGGMKPAVGRNGALAIISTPNPEPKGKKYKEMVLAAREMGFVRMDIHFKLNPNKDVVWEMEERASMSRQKFKYEHELSLAGAGAGMIFHEFDRDIHVVDKLTIGKEHKLYRTIDFGEIFACIWWSRSPGGTMSAYRELFMHGKPSTQRARSVIRSSGRERYQLTMGDEAAKQEREDLSANGVVTVPSGPKDTLDSIFIMKKYMEGDGETTPGLRIHQNCRRLISQIEEYVGDENGYPVKHQDDHGIDPSRYLFRWVDRAESGHSLDEDFDQYDEENFDHFSPGAISGDDGWLDQDVTSTAMDRELGIDRGSEFDFGDFGI